MIIWKPMVVQEKLPGVPHHIQECVVRIATIAAPGTTVTPMGRQVAVPPAARVGPPNAAAWRAIRLGSRLV